MQYLNYVNYPQQEKIQFLYLPNLGPVVFDPRQVGSYPSKQGTVRLWKATVHEFAEFDNTVLTDKAKPYREYLMSRFGKNDKKVAEQLHVLWQMYCAWIIWNNFARVFGRAYTRFGAFGDDIPCDLPKISIVAMQGFLPHLPYIRLSPAEQAAEEARFYADDHETVEEDLRKYEEAYLARERANDC